MRAGSDASAAKAVSYDLCAARGGALVQMSIMPTLILRMSIIRGEAALRLRQSPSP
jgi:hypothetical protein